MYTIPMLAGTPRVTAKTSESSVASAISVLRSIGCLRLGSAYTYIVLAGNFPEASKTMNRLYRGNSLMEHHIAINP